MNALSELGRRTTAPPISWLMKMTLDRPNLISLAAGFTDNESLPTELAKDLLDDILRQPKTGQAALQYGTTRGHAHLRRQVAERLSTMDAINQGREITADHVILTHGSQQLLYMVTEALCDPEDIVLVEDPTYFVFLGIMQSHQLKGHGIRMTPGGIDLEHLEQVLEKLKQTGDLPRVKMLYLVTYFQNPTGTSTEYERKAGALALLKRYEKAAGHPIYLLEDAAYRELRFSGVDHLSALAVPGCQNRVIYTSTFSKPFATGVRVGYGIIPEPVLSAVERIKANHDFGTANLLLELMAHAIESGAFDIHLKKLHERYALKAQTMFEAMQAHFPARVKFSCPDGGLYFWVKAAKGHKTGLKSKLFKKALECEVLYVPGQLCYADDPWRSKPDDEMRISFGGAKLHEIREGIKRLGEALTQAG